MSADPSVVNWVEKKALIIGRAYPEPSRKHIETMCTGAIADDGELLRLYPIPLRYLEENQKYKLWTYARFLIRKSPDDKRKESLTVKEGSIKVLSQIESKAERFSIIRKAMTADLGALRVKYREDWTSLGIIKIDLIDIKARIPEKNWAKEKGYMKQSHFFVDKKPLEQPPINISLKFKCKNNPECPTHNCRLIAWEYFEAFRSFRTKYGTGIAAFGRIRDRLTALFNDQGNDVYALMGTHSRYPVWMIGQLYFIEKTVAQAQRLFD
jgi:hypothetical protein